MAETGDAGHLAHMPSHIHALLGDFEGAARCSRRAVALDLEHRPYLERAPFYRTLHCHDAHMLMFAGMQTGNMGDALHGAAVIADLLRDVLIEPPTSHMMMTLEGYLSTISHVDIRFGRWQTVLDAVFDGDPAHRPVSWAMHHYARAVASAALGMFDSARQAAEAFDDARAAVPVEYAFFNNPADVVLTVADLMMRGEMAYHAGEIETAFDLLQQDGLGYNEPRAWMHPPRHALGALMLEQGRVAEALAIYECDLGRKGDLPVSRQNRGNIWSLAGLAECLHRLNGEDTGAADAELAAAMRLADRAVTSSCFCRGCTPVAGTV
jgi:tetratricopeptide (TPR) repeat protein